jgi:nucleoside-diphosphate-sugar epimerase
VKIHIVGGSGFLGKRVVRNLVSAGHEVTGVVRSEAASKRLAAAGGRPLS